ncbi:MAG: hypothetical protein ACW98F_00495 [Candidatus Hodarchaeales archaeon]
MLDMIIFQIIIEIITVFISIPFGLVSLTLGAIFYAPTGSKVGKYTLIYGLLVLTINLYLV